MELNNYAIVQYLDGAIYVIPQEIFLIQGVEDIPVADWIIGYNYPWYSFIWISISRGKFASNEQA